MLLSKRLHLAEKLKKERKITAKQYIKLANGTSEDKKEDRINTLLYKIKRLENKYQNLKTIFKMINKIEITD